MVLIGKSHFFQLNLAINIFKIRLLHILRFLVTKYSVIIIVMLMCGYRQKSFSKPWNIFLDLNSIMFLDK